MLRTHCCRHKYFPVCPCAQHLLRIQILCPGHKNVSDFVQKHFVSATNVPQFARARKRHEQQCFRNNVSSFASTLTSENTRDISVSKVKRKIRRNPPICFILFSLAHKHKHRRISTRKTNMFVFLVLILVIMLMLMLK